MITKKIVIEKCKTRIGYKVKLNKQNKIDLDIFKKINNESEPNKSKINNIEVISWTPIVVLIKYKETEIAIHIYGELHFKDNIGEELVKEYAEEIYEFIDKYKF